MNPLRRAGLNPDISPELQEVLYRALERDPRHRYATAHEMIWDIEHQEQVGVEERGVRLPGAQRTTRPQQEGSALRCLALVPLVLFGVDVVAGEAVMKAVS